MVLRESYTIETQEVNDEEGWCTLSAKGQKMRHENNIV